MSAPVVVARRLNRDPSRGRNAKKIAGPGSRNMQVGEKGNKSNIHTEVPEKKESVLEMEEDKNKNTTKIPTRKEISSKIRNGESQNKTKMKEDKMQNAKKSEEGIRQRKTKEDIEQRKVEGFKIPDKR